MKKLTQQQVEKITNDLERVKHGIDNGDRIGAKELLTDTQRYIENLPDVPEETQREAQEEEGKDIPKPGENIPPSQR